MSGFYIFPSNVRLMIFEGPDATRQLIESGDNALVSWYAENQAGSSPLFWGVRSFEASNVPEVWGRLRAFAEDVYAQHLPERWPPLDVEWHVAAVEDAPDGEPSGQSA